MKKKIFFIYLNFFDKFRRLINSSYINQIFHNSVINYLEKNFKEVILKYTNTHQKNSQELNKNVWLMWWQGEENAPDLVKKCIQSVRDNLGNVTIISKENYRDYVDIPEIIISKQKSWIIGMANFSDIMRFNLLSNHGGLWIDATIFLKDYNPDLELSNPYYTIKGNDYFNNKYVPKGRWRGFFQYGQKDLLLFKFSVEFFNEYWKVEKKLINFFLIDYILEIAYRNNIGDFKNINDRITMNNPGIYDLDKKLLGCDIILDFEKTHVFKLNIKHHYENKDNSSSNYKKFIESTLFS